MSDHVYKSLELTGSSSVSIEDAVSQAIKRAAKTVRKLRWFEIKEVRGQIDNDAVTYWQVSMKVGFALDE
jgi:flavin-binding protein dodecin